MAESNGQAQTAGGEGGATRLPLLNEPAPAFHARTTHGERGLEDYRGRWLIFFAHPADFTPVCASEFIAFSKAYDRFQELGCDLLGLSVDSLFAHIAWIANIKERFVWLQPARPLVPSVTAVSRQRRGKRNSPRISRHSTADIRTSRRYGRAMHPIRGPSNSAIRCT